MPTPALDPTIRFIHPGTAKTYWAGAAGIAALTLIPTRIEMNAMTDVTGQVSEATGWEQAAENVAVPDGGARFTSQVAGRINPSDAAIMFYQSKDTDDVRTLLHQDDTGYVLHLLGGDVASQKMDVWPVRVRAVSKPIDYGGSNAGLISVQFSITGTPAVDVTIPALT